MSVPAAVVGIDLGTGSARAVAIDRDGVVLGDARAPYPGADRWPAGRADPCGWLAGLTDAFRALARHVPAAARPAVLPLQRAG